METSKWLELGGDEFEDILASGAVQLLDLEWLTTDADSGKALVLLRVVMGDTNKRNARMWCLKYVENVVPFF